VEKMGRQSKMKAASGFSHATEQQNVKDRIKSVAYNNNDDDSHVVTEEEIRQAKEKILLAEDHLPPLSLVFIVLFCSGVLLVLSLRDFASTGRNLLGQWDEAMLVSTNAECVVFQK
jgi:hypothetical protein